jgi:hypothetical protein
MLRTQKQWASNLFIYSSLSKLGLGESLLCGARQAYLLRDYARLKIIGEELVNLSPRFESIGRYYLVLATERRTKENHEDARKELSLLIESPIVRIASMIAYAGAEISLNNIKPAAALLLEASALSVKSNDFIRFIQAQSMLSALCSIDGNHIESLRILWGLQPIINKLDNSHHIMKVDQNNSLCVELAKLGRYEAAKGFALVVSRSPYISAYPEWQETLDELQVTEYKRTIFAPVKTFVKNNLIQFPVKKYVPPSLETISVIIMRDSQSMNFGECTSADLDGLDNYLKVAAAARAVGLEGHTAK